MKLAITVLGNKTQGLIPEMLATLSACHCDVLELRSSGLSDISWLYLLVDGNWNQIAKLEGLLELIATRLGLEISFLRPEEELQVKEGVPYLLETISADKKDLMFAVSAFLQERGVFIEEITASRHQAPYFNHSVFSSKFVLLVPANVHILSLREEFLDFCDDLNIDAILEPIKR